MQLGDARRRRYPTSRPYKCEESGCLQSFNQRIHLKKHQQSKHIGECRANETWADSKDTVSICIYPRILFGAIGPP